MVGVGVMLWRNMSTVNGEPGPKRRRSSGRHGSSSFRVPKKRGLRPPTWLRNNFNQIERGDVYKFGVSRDPLSSEKQRNESGYAEGHTRVKSSMDRVKISLLLGM